eukprot:SAG22_NODE_7291_length_754_cov_1.876336_1_plen_117_part_00
MYPEDEDHPMHVQSWVGLRGWDVARSSSDADADSADSAGGTNSTGTGNSGRRQAQTTYYLDGEQATGLEPWEYDALASDFLFTRYMQAVFDVLTDMVIERAQTDMELVTGLLLHIM